MSTLIAVFSCLIVLLLPGSAILVWIKREPTRFAACLADCIGLSISITTALFLLTFYTPLRITPIVLSILYILCTVICLTGILRRRIKPHWSWEIPITLFLLGAVLVLRFYQVRGLLMPAWVDSIHHTLITKVIIEQGAIPATLEPYLSVPFSYYFGFHGLAAVFAQVSGLPVEKAILCLGQVLNACVPLAIYRLGLALWNDRFKSLIAALLVAFISQMPAYYVTWGRYTLLTGLFMLALVMAGMIEVIRRKSLNTNLPLLAVNMIGMVLSHYFCGVIFIPFALLLLIPSILSRDRAERTTAMITSSAMFAAILAITPWLYRAYGLAGFALAPTISIPASSESWQAIQDYSKYLWKLAGPLRNQLFLVVGLLGIIPMWMARQTRYLAIWALAILVCALPLGIGLPNIRADHMVIILFFPFCLSATCLLEKTYKVMSPRISATIFFKSGAFLICAGLIITSIFDTRTIVNPSTVFVTQADLSAIQWIKTNLPADAKFLINSAHWQATIYRGIDGGFWLLPLTGNSTIPPPVVASWGDVKNVEEINGLSKLTAGLKTCDEPFWQVAEAGKITHVYIREGVGSMQADKFLNCTDLKRIYFIEGVSIFEVDNDFK
jgi:hypothetical protein